MVIKTVGIIANRLKQNALDLVKELRSFLAEKGIDSLYLDTYTDNDAMSRCGSLDLMIILGGDGTILNYARVYGKLHIPILGINFGKLGFIAEVQPELYREALTEIIEGKGIISKRLVMKVEVDRKDGSHFEYYALNDVVITHKNVSRMLLLNTYINNRYLIGYNGDGLIISGPTGSTAYNLSAGGPVLHPEVNALILTPVCPHTLGERPLVIPSGEKLAIVLSDEKAQEAMVTVDGQAYADITSNDSVKVGVADYTVDFVLLNRFDFYTKLRTRLFWGR